MSKEVKENIKEENKKVRKVFLDDLPKWETGRYKGHTCWDKSINNKVRGTYETIDFEIEIVEYKDKYLYIKYLNEPIFKISVSHFQRCKLGKLLKKYTCELKYDVGLVFKNDKRNIIIIDKKVIQVKNEKGYTINQKWYKYHCNKCNNEKWVTESDLKKGSGCNICCKSSAIFTMGVNNIPATAPWMVKYFQGGYEEAKLYMKCSRVNKYFKCPECGRIKKRAMGIIALSTYGKISCTCGDGFSFPAKFTFEVLEQLSLKFEIEYNPKWCKYIDFNDINKIKTGRYDFKLNNYPYILEVDGGWHGKDNNLNGQTKEESKYIDNEKDRLAKENGYEVIRIDCDKSELEFIKQNILGSKLNELFDLSNIDWLKCEEFAVSNLCKVACDYKKDNPNVTCKEIAEIMQIGAGAVRGYLKEGTNIGWCNYSAKEEHWKRNIRNGENKKKPIEVYKDGNSLGTFKSAGELQENSIELFGVKLYSSNISCVCRGQQSHHHGYIFKYI